MNHCPKRDKCEPKLKLNFNNLRPKKMTLNRTSRNQKVGSREGDVIKEVYPLE